MMSHPAIGISAELTLAQAQPRFARYRYTALPVIDADGRAIGMLTIASTPPSRWAVTVVADLAQRDPAC